jgi:pimeloyl-ACP methyl ester carboxylesterase
MRPLMAAAGHTFFTPTQTGLGERAHLSNPSIDLETHIADVLAVLDVEDLRDVVLLGHSYGGMIATAVADRAPDRIAKMIYVDAFVPRDGQSLAALVGPDVFEEMRASAAAGDGWRIPSPPIAPDTSPEDRAWIEVRRTPQPLKCFEQVVKLRNGEPRMPRTYIRAMNNKQQIFGQFADRARTESGWTSLEIASTHSPNVTAPAELMGLLEALL